MRLSETQNKGRTDKWHSHFSVVDVMPSQESNESQSEVNEARRVRTSLHTLHTARAKPHLAWIGCALSKNPVFDPGTRMAFSAQ